MISWRKIRDEIKNHAARYTIAVSGGVDSIFLLDFIRKIDGLDFIVAHFNHKMRNDEEHNKDYVLVRDICRKYDLDFYYGEGKDITSEKEARDQRYAWLTSIAPDRKIVTAHHLNDQIETIFLRLVRGIPHYSLTMKKDNGFVYRPFLEIPKSEIIKQAKRFNLKWNEDSTNECNDFERNHLRNVIIPEFMKFRNIEKSMSNALKG